MVAQNIAFGIIAAVVTVGAVMVVTTRNIVRAALWLVAVLAGVGASFLLVGAEFVGVTQILLYVGAIVVLFLFGIMLTKAPIGGTAELTGKGWATGIFVAVPLAVVLGYVLIDEYGTKELDGSRQLTAGVSDSIFGPYLVPFEVASILILAALIGSIVLARKD